MYLFIDVKAQRKITGVLLVSLYLPRTLGGSKELNVRLSNIEEETPHFHSKDGTGCEEI